MKLKKSIFFSLLLLMIFFSYIPYSKSFYGDGDCSEYHIGRTIKVPFDPNAVIQLDGIANEIFWEDSNNENGKAQFNVSTLDRDITTLNMSFVRNNNYLLILCEWPDISTHPATQDGFFICWNINTPNFSAYYPGGMETDHMGGGYIDSWMLVINYLNPINNSDTYCKDTSFGPVGDTGENDQITVQVGYNTIINTKYTIEIRRKLTTSDKTYDVQLDQTKRYGFNLGILNNSAMSHDHAISYTHYLEITYDDNGIIDGYLVIPLLLGITSLSIIYIFNKHNNINRIN